MQLRKCATLTLFAIGTLLVTPSPAKAQEYEIGNTDAYNDDGSGFDNGYSTPSAFRLILSGAAAIGLIVGAISIASDSSGH
ncbi:hypothetical protein SCG7086_AD_00310 [Chlamydiales bacterium SCGC AG-110-P3]|nr:hypothetical protein SCG7086_AD_00310 [Chlamydiales bacterium SCGC AG-110-P3]